MIKTLFFIPANKLAYFKALELYQPDYYVFDLEDSVSDTEYIYALQNLLDLKEIRNNYFIRPDISKMDIDFINTNTVLSRFKNFLLPKVESLEQLKSVLKLISNNSSIIEKQFFITIESPLGLLNLTDILKSNICNIRGVGFGSHDYCRIMGVSHSADIFAFARNYILNIAKAFNCLCIDIASTNLSNQHSFLNECIEGVQLGFDTKPVLHPWQYNIIQDKLKPFSQKEIAEAKEIHTYFNGMIPESTDAVKINGRIFEKPHINRIKKIIEYLNL